MRSASLVALVVCGAVGFPVNSLFSVSGALPASRRGGVEYETRLGDLQFIPLTRAFLAAGDNSTAREKGVSQLEEPQSHGLDFGNGEAIVLGLIEGITEFLPISSTGHLILANHLLGLASPKTNPPTQNHDNAHQQVDPTLIGEALDAYIIVIQFGAIAAVALLYWQPIKAIILGLLGGDKEGLFLARNLALAFIPAAVVGLAIHDAISSYLFNLPSVILALFVGGILMLWVEKWRKSRYGPNQSRGSRIGPDLHQLSPRQSLLIGIFQCAALWPGTSRSMITIIGGYAVGLSPRRAAEFSFLLGLPTLSAAALYKMLKSGPEMYSVLGWVPVLLGMAVAAISAALAVKWMVSYLTRHGLALFACYRIVLALSLATTII